MHSAFGPLPTSTIKVAHQSCFSFNARWSLFVVRHLWALAFGAGRRGVGSGGRRAFHSLIRFPWLCQGRRAVASSQLRRHPVWPAFLFGVLGGISIDCPRAVQQLPVGLYIQQLSLLVGTEPVSDCKRPAAQTAPGPLRSPLRGPQCRNVDSHLP